MGRKEAQPKARATAKAESQAKRRKITKGANKDELPVLSPEEKEKYKNQWTTMLATRVSFTNYSCDLYWFL